ncbi:MAG: alginate lyase family protein [Armatimonadota bacterium]|nr:alginate lyase family protein [Armatimonadota bacterium]
MKLTLTILIATLAIISPAVSLTKMGELSEYWLDYADVKQGATISSPCTANPEVPKLENIITPSRGGFFIFADGVEQREEFTIDLGQERKVGMFIFEMTNTIVYEGEVRRKPNSLTVGISTQSKDGPWTRVYSQDPADVVMSFALENVPARWVRFDLGVNKDGIGSRVRKAKIYPRYLLLPGPELMKEFHTQFKRDAAGLGEFWQAVDAGTWEEACDLMIEHFAKWPDEPKGEASPRVSAWMNNEVEASGCIYKYDSADWDWYRLRAECPRQSQGAPPGASTILHLLKTAYAATGDEAYAKQLAALLRDWLRDIPCPGVHRGQDGHVIIPWSGIIASQRTWSFGEMVHAMFKENKYWDRDLKINLLYSLWQHINFMRAISPELGGNWLTNANSCMFDGAVNYPEFTQYKEWLESSKSFFEMSLLRDFLPCGRPSEDSTMYVPIAANQVTGQYAAMKKAGVTISPEARKKMNTLWDCYARVSYPDLSLPAIGDAHRESPLMKNGQAVSGAYLELFDRPDLAYINSQGAKGKMPEQASRRCSDCGWYVMRSAWETTPYTDARQMFLKASKSQGHGHREQMSFTMYAYGREILTDPGNPNYGLPIEPKVRPTAVHNTICVDEKDQGGTPGIEHIWSATKGVDFIDAECAPYKGLTHRRQIVFLKSGSGAPDYWLIRDTVSGEGEHTFDLNFHFSEGAKPQVVNGSVCSTYAEGGNALLRCLDQSATPDIVDANISLLRELVPSKICRFRKNQSAPATFETLVMPFKGPKSPTIKAGYLPPDPECANADAVCIRVDNGFGRDFIIIAGNPGTALFFDNGAIKTDAAITVIRANKKGKVIYAFADSGAATYRGKAIR